jgi:O-antigen/teichoic acid export membrane protein
MKLRFIKNSLSNVMSGLIGAVLTLVLPHFFVHDFSPAVFAVWILILQFGNFMNIFNFGLAVAVSRYVALAIAKKDDAAAEGAVIAGAQLLVVMAGVGSALMLGVYVFLPQVFHQIPVSLMPEARASMLWIGGSFALALPFTAFSGGMMGLQRNEVPALINVIGKSAMSVVLVLAAAWTHDLVVVCRLFFFFSLATNFGFLLAFRALWPRWPRWSAGPAGALRRDLLGYCAGLSVWSVSMFFINGMDTAIVGAVDFKSVAAYGLAASLGVFFSGSMNVALNPLVQVFATHHAHGDEAGAIRLMRFSSIVCSTGLCAAGCWLIILEPALFTLWVGPVLARQAFLIFALLVVANALRNSTTPYSFYLLGSAQQNRVVLTPICEAATNFICSLVLSRFWGALGVACGALIGACVCVAANFLYNFKFTTPTGFSVPSMFWASLVLPILWSLPALLVVLVFWHEAALGRSLPLLIVASIVAGVFAFRFLTKDGGRDVAPVEAVH